MSRSLPYRIDLWVVRTWCPSVSVHTNSKTSGLAWRVGDAELRLHERGQAQHHWSPIIYRYIAKQFANTFKECCQHRICSSCKKNCEIANNAKAGGLLADCDGKSLTCQNKSRILHNRTYSQICVRSCPVPPATSSLLVLVSFR